MASASSSQAWSLQQQWVVLVPFVAASFSVSIVIASSITVTGCYTSVFSFGDSVTDTGNLYFLPPVSPNCLLPPYGETHFKHPNGRCSDGRLIVDFIAESLGLPYVKPYLAFENGFLKHSDIQQGVNFAVAGALSLESRFYEEKGFPVELLIDCSLRVQIDWFKKLLPFLCNSSSSCKKVLHSSLFLVGEFGGNDYFTLLPQTKTYAELRAYTPQVISAITSAIRELIDLGAVTLMVPAIFPLGCLAIPLTQYATIDEEKYDQAGCLKWLNMHSEYHNELLQIELNRLRVLYPHTNIIYADYFNAALPFYHSPKQFGFRNVIKICCGGGGPYNYNETAPCSSSEVIACDDPSQYLGWDGYHYTEAGYRWIAKGLLDGPYTIPKLSISCVTSETPVNFHKV